MIALDDFPNRRLERWRWSDLRAALGRELPPRADRSELSAEPGPAASAPSRPQASEIVVFRDGWLLDGEASEIRFERSDDFPVWSDGQTSPVARLVAEVAGSVVPVLVSGPENPVRRVVHQGGEAARSRYARLGVVVAAGEALTLIESFDGPTAGFSATLTQCRIAPGGRLTRIILQPSMAGCLAATAEIDVAAGGVYRQFVLAEGAKFARIETDIRAGTAADLDLNAAYLAGATRHIDLTSQVVLQAEGAKVRQLVRGASRKGGRGVFQGRFKVERAAQKTDARMAHNALLMDEGAEVFAKPELEIYADDVQCAHGNTAGQIDEAAVFYLRSRGLGADEARAMITRAFLLEALPSWLPDAESIAIAARIGAWLGGWDA